MSSVLIVDDDLDGSEPVARFLRRAGYRVICAPNGREALALLTGALPDVVLLDVRMPEMDGMTFLSVLRSYLRWQDMPVVLLTAYPDGPHIQQAARLGAKDVFTKGSVEFGVLASCIEQRLAGKPECDSRNN